MVSCLHEHVLEVDGIVFCETTLPRGVDLPVDVEKQPAPEAVQPRQLRREPAFEVLACPRVRLHMRHEGADEASEILVLHRLGPGVVRRPIRVPVERYSSAGELHPELLETVAVHDVAPGRLDQLRTVSAVQVTLPGHASA